MSCRGDRATVTAERLDGRGCVQACIEHSLGHRFLPMLSRHPVDQTRARETQLGREEDRREPPPSPILIGIDCPIPPHPLERVIRPPHAPRLAALDDRRFLHPRSLMELRRALIIGVRRDLDALTVPQKCHRLGNGFSSAGAHSVPLFAAAARASGALEGTGLMPDPPGAAGEVHGAPDPRPVDGREARQ